MAEKTKSNKSKKGKKIKSIEDYEEVISEMVQLIREDPNPLTHSGRLASLVNAWSGLYKLSLESKDIKEILERLDKIEAN